MEAASEAERKAAVTTLKLKEEERKLKEAEREADNARKLRIDSEV